MPVVRIDIPKLVRHWNKSLPSKYKSTNPDPIVYVKALKEIRGSVYSISNEIEAIATFTHEIAKRKWDNYDSVILAFYAILFLMGDNQLGQYVRGGSDPLHSAFNSVDSTISWIKGNYDLETF